MGEISEEKRKRIKQEAQDILRRFSQSLAKVKIKEGKTLMQEESGFREEGEGMEGDADFRKRMFANAPHKTNDTIIAEKKSW